MYMFSMDLAFKSKLSQLLLLSQVRFLYIKVVYMYLIINNHLGILKRLLI
jgi:hypothetical protein